MKIQFVEILTFDSQKYFLYWPHTPFGEYFTKSGYFILSQKYYMELWFLRNPMDQSAHHTQVEVVHLENVAHNFAIQANLFQGV